MKKTAISLSVKKNVISAALALSLLITVSLEAQSFSNVGSASGNFLKIPAEPTGAALGNAAVSTVRGVTGLYWNPAALSYTEGSEVLLSQTNWIADTKLSYIGLAQKLGPGSVGLSITALTMDEMEITTESEPAGTGEFFSSGSYAFGLSYGMNIIDRFSFGGTVKYVYEYIWETHGSALLFDFGSVYTTDFHNLRIGMRLANFGGNMIFKGSPIDSKADAIKQSGISYSYDPRLDRVSPEYSMPQLFNVGVAIDPVVTEDYRITLAASVNDPSDNNTQLSFGGECAYNGMLFLRAGYKSGFDEQNISAGLGLRMAVGPVTPQIDFAYTAFGKLGSVLCMGLKLTL